MIKLISMTFSLFFLTNLVKGQNDSINVNLKTNAKEISVFIDGNLVGKTKKGELSAALKLGWNAIDITSKGYLTKRFYSYVGSNGPFSLYFHMNKLPTADTQSIINPFNFGEEQLTPLQYVSSCKNISASTSGSQRGKLNCKALNLGEEIQSTGPLITNESALSTPVEKVVMEKFIDVTLGSFSENWRILGEKLHQITLGNVEGFEAAAWAALFAGDCNRVSELYEYVKVLAKYSPSVWLFQSVCFEMHGKPDLALKNINTAILERKMTSNSSAALYYHKARLELASSVDKAIATLDTCIVKYPTYKQCHSMASDLWLAKGNLRKYYDLKNGFLIKAQSILGPLVDEAIKASKQKKYDQALETLKQNDSYMNSFSISWLKVFVEKSKNGSTKLSSVSKAMFSSVMAPKSAKKVLKVIEKNNNPQLLEKALKILMRDLPKEPFYRWKISGLYLKLEDCKRVLTLKIPKYKMSPKFEAGLLEHKARCFEKSMDFEAAKKNVKAMTRLLPNNWKVHYQLGNIYFKNKETFKAVSSYREALSLKPPKEFVQLIVGRLDEIGTPQKPE